MNILIVENDQVLINVWARRFGREHTVQTARNVIEAINILHEFKPELVLLDLRLNGPNASGLVIYDNIREVCGPHVTVLMITGLEDTVPLYQEAYKISLDDPFTRLLDKPVDINILKGFMKSAV